MRKHAGFMRREAWFWALLGAWSHVVQCDSSGGGFCGLKSAAVTGGASGIGYALAKKCLRSGVHVVLSDGNAELLDAAAASLQVSLSHAAGVKTFCFEPECVPKDPCDGVCDAGGRCCRRLPP